VQEQPVLAAPGVQAHERADAFEATVKSSPHPSAAIEAACNVTSMPAPADDLDLDAIRRELAVEGG
jgi:hypothetical protein